MKAWMFGALDSTMIGSDIEIICYKDIDRVRYYNDYYKKIIYDTIENNIDTIITSKKYLNISLRILWENNIVVNHYIIDSCDEYDIGEYSSKVSAKLWDMAISKDAYNTYNPITQTGWISVFTGNYFSEKEMEEYANNIFYKLGNQLDASKSILEIGCASGISLFKLAPYVKKYHAIDVSEKTIELTSKEVSNRGLSNVQFYISDALDVKEVIDETVDVCIINSVAQYFPNYNYFFQVIRNIIEIMNDEGIIFVGDILDADLRIKEIEDLSSINRTNKLNSRDLWYSRKMISELGQYINGIEAVHISNKIGTISNELTKYRFDAIIKINKKYQTNLTFSQKKYGTIKDILCE